MSMTTVTTSVSITPPQQNNDRESPLIRQPFSSNQANIQDPEEESRREVASIQPFESA